MGALVALVGCMESEDYAEAIIGREPPPDPEVAADVTVDAMVVVDLNVVDQGRASVDAAVLETCNGLDDDLDGVVDEALVAFPAAGVRCCKGDGDTWPCNDAPAGSWLADGWAYVGDEGDGDVVMQAPVSVGQWRSLPVTEGAAVAGCATPPDPAAPMTCVDLYDALAFANAWSCARGLAPRYRRADDRPLTFDDIDGLVMEQAATGARLMSAEQYDRLAARCEGQCPGGCEATGFELLAVDWEWVWPAGAVSDSASAVRVAGCMPTALPARGGPAEFYRSTRLRLVCPNTVGRSNPCTQAGGERGVCQ